MQTQVPEPGTQSPSSLCQTLHSRGEVGARFQVPRTISAASALKHLGLLRVLTETLRGKTGAGRESLSVACPGVEIQTLKLLVFDITCLMGVGWGGGQERPHGLWRSELGPHNPGETSEAGRAWISS